VKRVSRFARKLHLTPVTSVCIRIHTCSVSHCTERIVFFRTAFGRHVGTGHADVLLCVTSGRAETPKASRSRDGAREGNWCAFRDLSYLLFCCHTIISDTCGRLFAKLRFGTSFIEKHASGGAKYRNSPIFRVSTSLTSFYGDRFR